MNDKLWWHLARAGGLVAWWTVSASVLWGLFLSTRVFERRSPPAWLLDLHRFLGGLAVTFTGLHVAGLMLDSYVHFGPTEILVPLAATWHPVAVAWGVVAFYLLAAVELTSLMMRRLPRRLWRRVHSLSFALFVLTAVHALSAGTDRRSVGVQWSALFIGAAFIFLMVYRALVRRRQARPARVPAGGAAPRPSEA
jgi:DMSO/TMAO reductase YedYZ heme-binding membrane subunit